MDLQLLYYFRDKNRLRKIKSDLLKQDTSKLYLGESRYSGNLKSLLDHNYFRCLGYSKNFNNLKLNVHNTTAIGGWCSIRTKDLNIIKEGLIENPTTGEFSKIVNVSDVVQWLKKSQSLDQIVESVGTFTGNKYVIMSEQKLWTIKLEKVLEKLFNRALYQKESQQIYDAIKFSEDAKYTITKKFINYITEKENEIQIIVDENHLKEIEDNKNRLLSQYNIDLEYLIEPILNKKKLKGLNIAKEKLELLDYANEYTKVWYFFSGDYVENILKKYNYVKTEKVALINSWQYSANYEIKLEQTLNKEILNKNGYLNKGTLNENVYFVSYLSAEDFRFRQYRSHNPLSQIPNISNYKKYILSLVNHVDKLNTTFLSNDRFFLDLFNFAQDAKSVGLLAQIIKENNKFSKQRKNIKQSDNKQKLSIISEIRKTKLSQNTAKIKELSARYIEMLNFIFQK